MPRNVEFYKAVYLGWAEHIGIREYIIEILILSLRQHSFRFLAKLLNLLQTKYTYSEKYQSLLLYINPIDSFFQATLLKRWADAYRLQKIDIQSRMLLDTVVGLYLTAVHSRFWSHYSRPTLAQWQYNLTTTMFSHDTRMRTIETWKSIKNMYFVVWWKIELFPRFDSIFWACHCAVWCVKAI